MTIDCHKGQIKFKNNICHLLQKCICDNMDILLKNTMN